MKKIIVQTSEAPQPIGPYSQAVIANGMLYVSGQIALKEDGSLLTDTIQNETHQVLNNIQAILRACDLDFEAVVKCSIFVKNMDNFSKINEVYASYFTHNPPARETVEVSQLPKNVNVEISCIALCN